MKKKGIKIVIMFLMVALLSTSFAPVMSYATSKTKITNNNTTKKITTTNNSTATQNKAKTVNNPTINTTVKDTNKTVSNALNRVTTNINTQKITTPTQSSALTKLVREKVVEETIAKNNGLEGIETSLETTIYKNFARIENVEVGSRVVYVVCIKNTTNEPKAVQVKATMPEEVLGAKTIAKIADVDNHVIDSEVDRGYINAKQVSYKGIINVNLKPNTEKVVIIEQDIAKYSTPTLETYFAVSCDGTVRNLLDLKHALTPANINAEMKLLVNDKETETGKTVQIGDNDVIKYVINVVNNGETAEAIDIIDALPKTFTIKKVEYLHSDNTKELSEEYDNSTFNITTKELKQNENMKIVLIVEPNINGELAVSNFAEISGANIKELNTNILENTFIVNKTNIKGVVIKDEALMKPATKGDTVDTQTILNHFKNNGLNMQFPAYADYNGTQLNYYGYQDMDAVFYIPMKGNALFRKTKDMFCINMGHSYYRNLKIENFYTVYNTDIYRYISEELKKGQLPSSGVGIGNSYNNLLNTHYNELAYMFSQVDSEEFGKGFYATLGINYDSSWDRPDHGLSPVQVSIWRLEGATDSDLKARIYRVFSNYYNSLNQNQRDEIVNKVMQRSAILSAYAKAYDNYVKAGNIEREPTIAYTNNNLIEVNGKKLAGPFKITYPSLGSGQQQYTDVSGNTHTQYGTYGEIRKIELTNNNTKYEKIYNKSGEEIVINNTIANPLEFYIDIKGKNFDAEKDTTVNLQMNNQSRNAYIYTLKSRTYDNGQHVIIGRGTAKIMPYQLVVPGVVIEKMDLSGIVWLDEQHGTKSETTVQPPNGIIDTDEKGFPGIKVSLLDNNKRSIVAETTTDNQGRYSFNNLEKSNYSVLFAFEGINYIVSEAAEGETNPTKTKVSEKVDGTYLRGSFTEKLEKIEKDKHITNKFELQSNGTVAKQTIDYVMAYDTEQGLSNYISHLITEENGNIIPAYKMYAKTTTTYSDTTSNINMGLKKRAGDISLRLNTTAKGKRNIRDANIEYVVNMYNEYGDRATVACIHEIDFYYEPNLTFVGAENRYTFFDNPKVENIIAVQEGEVVINGKPYKKMKLKLTEGWLLENIAIHVRFANTNSSEMAAYAEIAKYTISGFGNVDNDSRPGNGINANGTVFMEDDFAGITTTQVRWAMIKEIISWNR